MWHPLSSRRLCPRVLGNFGKGEATKTNWNQLCWLVSQLIVHSPLTNHVVHIAGSHPRVQFWVSFLPVEVNSQELT